jgi:hypothetical protein
VAALAALVPLAVVLLAHPASTVRTVRSSQNTEAPISAGLKPRITRSGTAVQLSWRPTKGGRTNVSYAVFRTAGNDGCTLPSAGARECLLDTSVLLSTANTTLTDRPGHGRFWYRVGAVADYTGNPASTDLMLIGPAVNVRVG